MILPSKDLFCLKPGTSLTGEKVPAVNDDLEVNIVLFIFHPCTIVIDVFLKFLEFLEFSKNYFIKVRFQHFQIIFCKKKDCGEVIVLPIWWPGKNFFWFHVWDCFQEPLLLHQARIRNPKNVVSCFKRNFFSDPVQWEFVNVLHSYTT